MSDDFEPAAIPGEQRAVVAERQRIAGEGLDAQLALDAVRGADDGHQDGILELCCGIGHLRPVSILAVVVDNRAPGFTGC